MKTKFDPSSEVKAWGVDKKNITCGIFPLDIQLAQAFIGQFLQTV